MEASLWKNERQLEAARPWGLAMTDVFFSAVCKDAHVPGPHSCLYASERLNLFVSCLLLRHLLCREATVLSVLLDPLVGVDFTQALDASRQNLYQDVVVINAAATVAEVKGHAIITRCATKKCTAVLQVSTSSVSCVALRMSCRTTASVHSMLASWRLSTV